MAEHRRVDGFYEQFWADSRYQLAYAFDSAVRDRFPAISKVWGDLRPPKRVLDYGCGNGVLSYWLWSNGFGDEIKGVDVSQTGIEYARSAFERPGLSFELLDKGKSVLQDHFDVVVSSHVLEHIDRPEAALTSMASMAEWLVIEVPLEKCLWQNLAWCLRKKSRKENALGHVNFWNKAEFKAFLSRAGLLVVREFQYASAPHSPFNHPVKRWVERLAVNVLGVSVYGTLMATHYAVLARKIKQARHVQRDLP